MGVFFLTFLIFSRVRTVYFWAFCYLLLSWFVSNTVHIFQILTTCKICQPLAYHCISQIYDLHFRIGYRLGWQLEVFAFYYDDYLQVTSVLSLLNLDWLISILIGFRLAHFRSHSEYCSVTVAAVMLVYQSYRHRVAFSVLELLSLSTLAGFRYFCGLIIFFLHRHTEGLLILSRKDYWAERI